VYVTLQYFRKHIAGKGVGGDDPPPESEVIAIGMITAAAITAATMPRNMSEYGQHNNLYVDTFTGGYIFVS
jgi:hypothetical protein